MVMNKVREINADNFNSIWEVISKESGILRDSNLDDILNN
jgi:predicted metalloprotease